MPLNAFIVRPFGVKTLHIESEPLANRLLAKFPGRDDKRVVPSIERVENARLWKLELNFDLLHELLIDPALEELRIKGEPASAVIVAGNIREDMFNRLVTADLVIADLSVHNANVFYELGVRQAFRDKYTFLIRADLSDYPFDLKTDRYFEYSLTELLDAPARAVHRLAAALRATLNSTDADSPIFKLLPQLEAEDRARFITVPEDFRDEVEWARHQLRGEHLSLMATECDGYLWEVEGLRVIGRAQFEANFIDGAKTTWEQIVNRYPDDIEANSVLSTIYQRVSDMKRSEQALSRAERTRQLSANRLSQLRSLSGRNLKAAWIDRWREIGDAALRERTALMSPLLQRAYDAFEDAFKRDLNNSYAGLNALSMLVIQTELAQRYAQDWKSARRRPRDAADELDAGKARIRQLIATLELALESDRERMQQQSQPDPWFALLEAAVACIVSDQPEYVARLYEQAVMSAPESAGESVRGSLQVYERLGIGSCDHDKTAPIGTIGSNVRRALEILTLKQERHAPPAEPQRVLMFVGLRTDPPPDRRAAAAAAAGQPPRAPAREVFPAACEDAARDALAAVIDDEIAKAGRDGRVALAIAAGAHGGDLLFHELCRQRGIAARLCLALPRAQYVGQYVAPGGDGWVERFSDLYRQLRLQPHNGSRHIREFTDSAELPRWLQSKPYYNVGRRNNLWMLQHAIAMAGELGEDAEITLIVLWSEEHYQGGIGGLGDVRAHAMARGIKVRTVEVPKTPAPPRAVPATLPRAA